MSFATQDRQKDRTSLTKQTINSREKTLTYKLGYHRERREDNTLGDSRHMRGKEGVTLLQSVVPTFSPDPHL